MKSQVKVFVTLEDNQVIVTADQDCVFHWANMSWAIEAGGTFSISLSEQVTATVRYSNTPLGETPAAFVRELKARKKGRKVVVQ